MAKISESAPNFGVSHEAEPVQGENTVVRTNTQNCMPLCGWHDMVVPVPRESARVKDRCRGR